MVKYILIISAACGLVWFLVHHQRVECEEAGGQIKTIWSLGRQSTVCVTPDGRLMQ